VKIATLAQSPVSGGRVTSSMRRGKGRQGRAQIVRLNDRVAVWPITWAPPEGPCDIEDRWDDGQNANLATDDIAKELEQATLVRPRSRRASAMPTGNGSAATKLEAIYQVPFLAACHDGADELHRAFSRSEMRDRLGSQAVARVQAFARRPRAYRRRSYRPQSSDRRRLWPKGSRLTARSAP